MDSRVLGVEDNKWDVSNTSYKEYMKKLGGVLKEKIDSGQMNIEEMPQRIISDLGCYVGDAKLANILYKYELYKKVINLTGDIGEVGIFRGSSFLFWAKLIKLFEPYNLTQVYGFDWFQGMAPSGEDDSQQQGQYCGEYQHLTDIISWQELDNIAIVQNMDVITGMQEFVEKRPHLRFKLLYIDCGIKEVMEASYKYLYPRLVKGGILMMDHYNYKVSPTESDIVEKYIGNNIIYQMPFARQPSGYIIKEV